MVRLDRFFVDSNPGVSFFIILKTMDRFQVSPGAVLASGFIGSLDFGPAAILYQFQIGPNSTDLIGRRGVDGAGGIMGSIGWEGLSLVTALVQRSLVTYVLSNMARGVTRLINKPALMI